VKAGNLSDRAKRYRANRRPPAGPRRCNFCGSRQNIDIDHIEADESDDDQLNKIFLCRVCNTRKGITQKRARIGIRTRQYNPTSATITGWKHAAAVLTGNQPGDVAAATHYIRQTSEAARRRFSEAIARGNPFHSEAQRKKFYAMLERGEIDRRTLEHFRRHNPAAHIPTYGQYGLAVAMHDKKTHAHDEGGAIIHATPPAVRAQYARKIAAVKKRRGTASRVPF
jgi:hypothetical protein